MKQEIEKQVEEDKKAAKKPLSKKTKLSLGIIFFFAMIPIALALGGVTVLQVAPRDGIITMNATPTLSGNISTLGVGEDIENMTVYVYNSSNQLINQTTVTFAALEDFAQVNISVALPRPDTYNWSYFGCDSIPGVTFDCVFTPNRTYTLTENIEGLAACGELNVPNQIYWLEQNLTTNSTCLIITRNNITVDGRGYSINYSANGTLGYGVNISIANYTTIKNINFREGSPTTNAKNAILSTSVSTHNMTIINVSTRNVGISNAMMLGGRNIAVWNSTCMLFNEGRCIQITTNSLNIGIFNTQMNSTSTGTGALMLEFIGNSHVYIENVTSISNRITFSMAGGSGYNNFTINRSNFTTINPTWTNIFMGGLAANFTIYDTYLNAPRYHFNASSAMRTGIINLTNVSQSNGTYIVWGIAANSNFSLTNQWWLDVNVTDSVTLNPLQNAEVNFTNNSGQRDFTTTTNAAGRIQRMDIIEFRSNITLGVEDRVYANNYTLNVSLTGYQNYTNNSVNMSHNLFMHVSLIPLGGNSCTYGGSGNWNVMCSDNCIITANVVLAGTKENNVTIIGTGDFVLDGGNVSNFYLKYLNGSSLSNICRVGHRNGGGFKQ